MQSGFSIKLGFDHDPICIGTLKQNPLDISHPCIQADICSLKSGRIFEFTDLAVGDLDLLAGGPPCQGFSVQRTKGGDVDARNMLILDYADLVETLFPRFFLMENVTGILGKRGHAVIHQFKSRMLALGYWLHVKTIDAQHYGVPQRRKRVIIVGERVDGETALYEWPKCETSRQTVRDVIGHLPEPPHDGSDHPLYPGHRADRLSSLNKKRLSILKEGQGREHLPPSLLSPCHRISSNITGHRNVYGRMEWDEVAPTITARFDSFTRGQFGHPDQIRTISLYEGALLQTFPKYYHFEGNKFEIARQIGNAVPPRLAFALGRSIIHALQRSDPKTTNER